MNSSTPTIDEIRPHVGRKLREIETRENIRVLYACESGSRAWGFASPDSDFDVRFIYARPVTEYLQLRPPVDAFDVPIDDDLDFAGWDIRKTAELAMKSNGPLFEWLESPIVYEAHQPTLDRLRQLRNIYFDSKKSGFHYLKLASNTWKNYLHDNPSPIRKKYLYALRPITSVHYVTQFSKQPPTQFRQVLDAIDLHTDIRHAIDEMLMAKQNAHELSESAPHPMLHEWIRHEIDTLGEIVTTLPTNPQPFNALNELICDVILEKPHSGNKT